MLNRDAATNKIQRHTHDGLNSEQISGANLGGFAVRVAAPTENAEEGKVVFSNVSGTYKIHVYINGGWREATLT